MKNVTIAIDGPAAAGKSTVAKVLARKFGLVYIDTGAMYRAFTYAVIKAGLNPEIEADACKMVGKVFITLEKKGVVICNGEDVTREIREFAVSSKVSYIASYKCVRLNMVELQREMAKNESVIMDGRDIGTYVLPDADLKIYQIADLKSRVERRYIENLEKGIDCTYEEVEDDLKRRDYIDSNRSFAPLKPAEDAIQYDTSNLTLYDSIEGLITIIKEKLGLEINE